MLQFTAFIATPTIDPTPLPTLDYWIIKNYSLTLNAAYDEFNNYTQSNATKQKAMALNIVQSGLGTTAIASLSNMNIIILAVRRGSIIIDYALSTNNELLMEMALSNMNSSMGTSIVIGNLTFNFSSNVEFISMPMTVPPKTGSPTTLLPTTQRMYMYRRLGDYKSIKSSLHILALNVLHHFVVLHLLHLHSEPTDRIPTPSIDPTAKLMQFRCL